MLSCTPRNNSQDCSRARFVVAQGWAWMPINCNITGVRAGTWYDGWSKRLVSRLGICSDGVFSQGARVPGSCTCTLDDGQRGKGSKGAPVPRCGVWTEHGARYGQRTRPLLSRTRTSDQQARGYFVRYSFSNGYRGPESQLVCIKSCPHLLVVDSLGVLRGC